MVTNALTPKERVLLEMRRVILTLWLRKQALGIDENQFVQILIHDQKLLRVLAENAWLRRVVAKDKRVYQAILYEAQFRRGDALLHPRDHLGHFLRIYFPVLYTQVLESTLADLRLEHSAALAATQSFRAFRILLRGGGALVAAAIYQLGYTVLDRITDLWQAKSRK